MLTPDSSLPFLCTNLMKVGNSSAFTRHTNSKTMVIPIRLAQARAVFSQG